MARRDEYDEAQAARRLKVPVTTWRWARHLRLIPEPDVSAWQWSRAAVEARGAEAVRASEPRELVSPWEAGRPAGHLQRHVTAPMTGRQRCFTVRSAREPLVSAHGTRLPARRLRLASWRKSGFWSC